MSYPSLRPHHGMCFQFYEGKGYSPDFTDYMGKMIEDFEDAPQQVVRIIPATDIVCENCPNNEAGVCVSQDKVTRYDEEVLKACRISDGEMMPYSEFLTLVKERIINRNLRSTICSDCSWDYICREKEPNPNSGIHLSTL